MSTAAPRRSPARCTTPPAAACPMLIFAGASPFTQEGELKGSRNEFIQWIQDVPDQRGIVRGYVKYDNEIRTGSQRPPAHPPRAADRPLRPRGAGLSRWARAR